MRHYRALLDRYRHGRSNRRIAREAGLSANKISHYLKASSRITHMPTPEALTDIARALGHGCTPLEVMEAFGADLGYPWP